MRFAIFIVLFGLVLGFATITNEHGGVGIGSHQFSSYGWPQRWLTIDYIQKPITIHSDGRREGGERSTKWSIGFSGLVVSAGTAAGIAVLLSVPLFLFWPGAKSSRDEGLMQ